MAVYTDISDEELDDLLARYDVGEVLSCKGIAEGVENSNFLLHTEAGYYILTLYEKRVNRDDLPFFLGLMEHLAAKGFVSPTPVPTREGKTLTEAAGRPAAIIQFLEGRSIKRITPDHCQKLGQTLARLHVTAGDFTLTRRNTLSIDGWRPLFESCFQDGRIPAIPPAEADEIAAELAHLEQNWPTDLPSGVIHADLFPDNIFFLKETVSGVIDYYFACNDFLAYDLAICLNAWCFENDGSFNITKARRLLNGYQSVRQLTDRELEALPLLCQGAALRFYLTRLYDWINQVEGALVKPKDPGEYLKKIRFHKDVASVVAYGFDLDRA
ncbi:homoserine kinase [Sneathiella chinensis]|uniref:Homoserine kinase n=1 Tax=Sneathiella chinensis TaxID=349750 RepID=A0ABQ5U2V5_9PROT|nr:homoserine kinase [Sneathiella chinensis]GLQ05682.1 homoserine kinase [Sneathiella chinensis]